MVQWDSHSYMTYRKVNGRVVTRRGQQLLKLFVTQTYTMPKRKHDGTKTKADRAKNGTADAPAAAATAEGGQKERYTFFFTAASPFSQWHPCEFTVDGVKYTCAEQFMMHQKAGNCWLVNCRWSEFILQGVVMGLESRKLSLDIHMMNQSRPSHARQATKWHGAWAATLTAQYPSLTVFECWIFCSHTLLVIMPCTLGQLIRHACIGVLIFHDILFPVENKHDFKSLS